MAINKTEEAIKHLRKGKTVLVHDSNKREDEIDFVKAAQYIKPEDIATMRRDGGGLICLTIGKKQAETLKLPFLSEIHHAAEKKYPILRKLRPDIKYDKHSAFSVSINHRKTFTGITDEDRALTISEVGKLLTIKNKKEMIESFTKNFRAEGHVPLLISSGLENRQGHTELSTALMEMAGLPPAAAICEMMDLETHKALTYAKGKKYAEKNNLILIKGEDIIKYYQRWRK